MAADPALQEEAVGEDAFKGNVILYRCQLRDWSFLSLDTSINLGIAIFKVLLKLALYVHCPMEIGVKMSNFQDVIYKEYHNCHK